MKNTFVLIIVAFLSLSIEAQETTPDTIYFNYDTEYFSKVEDQIFIDSKRTSKHGFRFLITDVIHLNDSKIEGINFKDFLISNNFDVIKENDFSMKVSKFVIATRTKQMYILRKEKNGICLYKVVSKIEVI